jgi:hypothetical protein
MGDHVGQQESTDLAFVLADSPATLWVMGLGSSSLADVLFSYVLLQFSQTCVWIKRGETGLRRAE